MRVPAVVDSLGASSSGMRIPIAWDDPVLRRADQLWPECWPVIVEEGGVRWGSVRSAAGACGRERAVDSGKG